MFEFWLKDSKKGTELLLPVTPKEYSISHGVEMEILRATEVGDINLPKYIKPKVVNLSSFFTVADYPFTNAQTYNANNPMDYVKLIKRWIDQKTVIRLIIADEEVTKINDLFYVENIKYSESNGTNGDINYEITLREYIKLKAVSKKVDDAPNIPAQNTERKEYKVTPEQMYVATVEDNLKLIGRKLFGDQEMWTKIYNANKEIIGRNPLLLKVGQVLKIPFVDKNNKSDLAEYNQLKYKDNW